MMKIPKQYCKELAETISNEDLSIMLKTAKENVKDWTVASRANKGLSRGTNWNLFCKDFNVNEQKAVIIKYRMLEEFGEFLPKRLLPNKPEKQPTKEPVHFDPNFDVPF